MKPKSPIERAGQLFLEPPATVVRADERRNARLFSTLILLITLLTLATAVGGLAVERRLSLHIGVELVATLVLGSSYVLSRTRHYRLGPLVGMVCLAGFPISGFLTRDAPDPNTVFAIFPWLVVPCTGVGLFYSVRAGFLLLAAELVAIATIAFTSPMVRPGDMVIVLAIVGALSTANLLVQIHQRHLEADRGAELASANARLTEVQAGNALLLSQAQRTTRELSGAAAEILVSTEQQSKGAAEQSASADQAASAAQDLDRLAQEAAATSRAVAEALTRAEVLAQGGRRDVSESAKAIARLRDDVRGISVHMRELAERTRRVGQIINAVEDFAAQSKILALNAAIEAAGAGEAGVGFAVVAREIRTLAERSRQDTAQVRAILQEVLKGARAAAEATELAVTAADDRIRMVEEVRHTIEQVAETVRGSSQQALSSAERGAVQAQSISAIAGAVRQMSEMTAAGLGATRQVESSARLMSELSAELQKVVERYQA